MLHLDKEDFIFNDEYLEGIYDDTIPRTVMLKSTITLDTEADRIQKAKGELPLFDDSGDYDDEDWYNFYLICDLFGFVDLYFDYGLREIKDYVHIELDEESKQNAYEKMFEWFGGYDEYVKSFKEVEVK